MYSLNLSNQTSGRVLSVTESHFAPEWQPQVASFPNNVTDYLYENGEFIYDPIEVEEQPPTPEERISALEEQNEMLLECILEMSELLYE